MERRAWTSRYLPRRESQSCGPRRNRTNASQGRGANQMNEPLSRRDMLKQLGVILGVGAGFPVSVHAQARTQALSAVGNAFISLNPAEAEILRAIVARIIPADENGPGALEARADRY